MYSNRFEHLEDYNNDTSNSNNIKKALKKLREIQVLEQRDNLTQQELDKISEKNKWNAMLPSFISDTETEKIHVKTKQKEKREKEKRLKIEREQKARDKKEEDERIARAQKEEEERLARLQKIEDERLYMEKLKEKYKNNLAINIKEVEEEWIYTLFNIHNNDISKTFRFLSKKYHPDKNSKSQELQKHLVNLRDMYQNR